MGSYDSIFDWHPLGHFFSHQQRSGVGRRSAALPLPPEGSSSSLHSDACKALGSRKAPITVTAQTPEPEVSYSSPAGIFFTLLRKSLLLEVDEDSTNALVTCVEVLLDHDPTTTIQSLKSFLDVLDHALDRIKVILIDNAAPQTAKDVEWWYRQDESLCLNQNS